MKQLIRRTLRSLGVEVARVRRRPDLMGFIQDRNIDLVLDVGANIGQFGEFLRRGGYRGTIRSFEPIPSVFQALAERAKADGNWEANNFGLGAVSATATIHVSVSSTYSSMLPMKSAATLHDESAVATREEAIEIRTLDEVFAASGEVLLKIDTQGYERQVLEGGRRVLPMMKGILMELPIIHFYKGTWQFHEAVEYMQGIGFIPAQINPVNYHLLDRFSLLEVDCLFRPRDDRLD